MELTLDNIMSVVAIISFALVGGYAAYIMLKPNRTLEEFLKQLNSAST